MPAVFEFTIDEQSREFCEAIAATMIDLFKIPASEAIGRINRHWQGQALLGPEDVVYCEDEVFWANEIYYNGQSWWQDPPDLKPLPYP